MTQIYSVPVPKPHLFMHLGQWSVQLPGDPIVCSWPDKWHATEYARLMFAAAVSMAALVDGERPSVH